MALDQQALEAAREAAHRSRSNQPHDIDAQWADGEAGEAAVAAYLAALGDGWQTIETALKKVDETVLLRIEHANYAIAPDEEKHRWEEVVTAYWTDFNSGGWVWHGLAGAPTHYRPLPTPPGEKK